MKMGMKWYELDNENCYESSGGRYENQNEILRVYNERSQ